MSEEPKKPILEEPVQEVKQEEQEESQELKWISCKERMPDTDVKVLVSILYGAGNRETTMSFTTKRFPDIFDHLLGDRITHWMPYQNHLNNDIRVLEYLKQHFKIQRR